MWCWVGIEVILGSHIYGQLHREVETEAYGERVCVHLHAQVLCNFLVLLAKNTKKQ